MDNSVKITLIIVAGIIILVLLPFLLYQSLKPGLTVTSNGVAEIEAMPDLVSVYFNVETRGDSAKEANDKNSEIVDGAITGLVKLGLERKDIVTENFNVYPNYVWQNGRQEIKGYIASHSLKVVLKEGNFDKAGKVIDAGIDAGANLNYINFELSLEKQNDYKTEALKQATEDARSKAEGIAAGLGKEVGKVVSVSESNFGYNPWMLYQATGGVEDRAEAKVAATNIQPGDKKISATVNVVFKLV